jgi:hypothetical protein
MNSTSVVAVSNQAVSPELAAGVCADAVNGRNEPTSASRDQRANLEERDMRLFSCVGRRLFRPFKCPV